MAIKHLKTAEFEAAVEAARVGVLVGPPPAQHVAYRQGDHDGGDDDGPYDLAGAEVWSQQPACAQLDRHGGHAGKELGEIEVHPAFE